MMIGDRQYVSNGTNKQKICRSIESIYRLSSTVTCKSFLAMKKINSGSGSKYVKKNVNCVEQKRKKGSVDLG